MRKSIKNPLSSILRILVLFLFVQLFANPLSAAEKKYPSLLWEISGNGLEKPSYLYGTMHVSNKLAFHLSDTFFVAIKNCDAVALELDPETMMEDIMNSPMLRGPRALMGKYRRGGYGFYKTFNIQNPTNSDIGEMLAENEELINSVLYRRYGGYSDNFREETYLDLFIFQAGKKLGLDVVNLEDFEESMKLVMKSSMPDKDDKGRKKLPKYLRNLKNGKTVYDLIEEAYRKGDLDMLDSLSKLTNPSKNHQKYMIDERNINMANRLDSLLKHKAVFTGVGAAHLPGEKGIIELLREKGYTMRPIMKEITEKSKEVKKKIEKMRYKLTYSKRFAPDSIFSINSPGKFLTVPSNPKVISLYYPDMVNGSYYTVSRIRTYNSFFNNNLDTMLLRIDSLLFENIPGDIVEKKFIERNGHKGISVLNKLLRGDFQRYQIFVMPEELIMFKINGPDDFVKSKESDEFFDSLMFVPLTSADWKTYDYPYRGFSIEMPQICISDFDTTYQSSGSSRDIISVDHENGAFYFMRNAVLQDNSYIEEDTFELSYIAEKLADEIDCRLEHQEFVSYKGYPSMLAYMVKDNFEMKIRTVIKGSNYFLLAVKPVDEKNSKRFLNSLEFSDCAYLEEFEPYTDTSMFFKVNTVKQDEDFSFLADMYSMYRDNDDEDNSHKEERKSITFSCEGSSEDIVVDYLKFHRYSRFKDSAAFVSSKIDSLAKNKEMFVRERSVINEDSLLTLDFVLADTASAQIIRRKIILKLNDGVMYTIETVGDTLTPASKFVSTFWETFEPIDTIVEKSMFADKPAIFFDAVENGDSTAKAQAFESMGKIKFLPEHAPKLIKLYKEYEFEEDQIDDRKQTLTEIGYLKQEEVIPFLRETYTAVTDTATLQLTILQSLARQKSDTACAAILDLLNEDTPLTTVKYEINSIFSMYYDTLDAAIPLFPEILDYAQYPEYVEPIYELLAKMKKKDVLSDSIYHDYIKKIIRQAGIALKRRIATESGRQTRKALYSYNDYSYYNNDENDILENYAILIYPYYDDPIVKKYFNKVLTTKDEQLKMNIALLLVEHELPISDTLIEHLAKDLTLRNNLYKKLEKLEHIDLFPDEFKNQEAIAESDLYGRNFDPEKDTIICLEKRLAVSKKGKGYVYFFKRKNDARDSWYLDYSGFQPVDEDSLEVNPKITQRGPEIENDAEIEEEIEKILKNIRVRGRERADRSEEYRYNDYYYDY